MVRVVIPILALGAAVMAATVLGLSLIHISKILASVCVSLLRLPTDPSSAWKPVHGAVYFISGRVIPFKTRSGPLLNYPLILPIICYRQSQFGSRVQCWREKHCVLIATTSTFEHLVGGFGAKARYRKVPGFTFVL